MWKKIISGDVDVIFKQDFNVDVDVEVDVTFDPDADVNLDVEVDDKTMSLSM